ncbi:MAG: TetR/AcrR family transcriptional regulator [Christensenellales bacterium]
MEEHNMRERIICESISSLRQEGLRFSVDTLAERLNVSKKTIYKFFPNKEALAFALYQRYYTDVKAEMRQLIKENSVSARSRLLLLYFDAKSMTCKDIFNKYKLNGALFSYTAEQNDILLEMILLSINVDFSEREKSNLQTVINGTFEKLCDEKTAPDGVVTWLENKLWE